MDPKLLIQKRKGIISGPARLTPKDAEELLKYNVRNYRRMNLNKARILAEAISLGTFALNPVDHIVLYYVGKTYILLNGQTRLQAAVLAGESIDVFITIVPEKVSSACDRYIDGNNIRKMAHHLAHRGIVNEHICAQIVRLIYTHQAYQGKICYRYHHLSIDAALEVFEQYKRGILFSAELTSHKEIGVNAAYRTAMAKAYYCYKPARLGEFHEQFVTHQYKDLKTDNAAQLLFNYYVKNKLRGSGGEMPTKEYYLHCEWAIAAFAEKENVTVLRKASKEGERFTVIPINNKAA
jgi:hypothetical protein